MKPLRRYSSLAALTVAVSAALVCPARAADAAGLTFPAVYYPPASPLEIALQVVLPIFGGLLTLYGGYGVVSGRISLRGLFLFVFCGLALTAGSLSLAAYFEW